MQQSSVIIAVLFSLLTSACRTAIKNEFRGEVINLKKDGQRETIRSQIPGTASGPYKRGYFMGFHLNDPAFSFYFFGPERVPGKTHILNTKSKNVSAWLIRGQEDFRKFIEPEQVKQHGGVNLKGKLAAYYKDKSSVGYKIAVDLHAGGNDSVSIKGEFIGYSDTEFESGYLSPASYGMLFYSLGAELIPSPAYRLYSPSQAESATAQYLLKASSNRAVLTAVKLDGKPIWERAYLVSPEGQCVPHGEWKQYSERNYLVERTQYRYGKLSGQHWVKLDWVKYRGEELESYWKDRTPVGIWKVDSQDSRVQIFVHFNGGKEVLKEWFVRRAKKAVLLQKWEYGKETFKAKWDYGPTPKIAKKSVYMSRKLLPDFEPERVNFSELQQLAKKKHRE